MKFNYCTVCCSLPFYLISSFPFLLLHSVIACLLSAWVGSGTQRQVLHQRPPSLKTLFYDIVWWHFEYILELIMMTARRILLLDQILRISGIQNDEIFFFSKSQNFSEMRNNFKAFLCTSIASNSAPVGLLKITISSNFEHLLTFIFNKMLQRNGFESESQIWEHA